MSTLFSYLTRSRDALLADLERLVRAESPSDQKRAVDECGRVLQRLFEDRIGVRALIFPQPVVGNHLWFSVGNADRQILIIGHFDTVWDTGRLSYRVEGENAFGPGIFDMKGGLIQAMWAVRAIRELGFPLNRKIVFLLTTDEEVGSPTSREIIEQEAMKSEVVLVVEPPVAGTNALKTGRKGLGQFTVRIKGKAAHAGNNSQDGISAVREMAHQILFLDSLTDHSVGITVNAGIAQGGTRLNVIAEQAEIHVDVRVAAMSEADRMVSVIRHLTPVLPGALISVEGGIIRPPMERSEATEKLFSLAAACGKELGVTLTEATVGGGSDGNFTAALGIPTLDGLGAVGKGAHAENEQVVIGQLPVRAALLGELILKIATSD